MDMWDEIDGLLTVWAFILVIIAGGYWMAPHHYRGTSNVLGGLTGLVVVGVIEIVRWTWVVADGGPDTMDHAWSVVAVWVIVGVVALILRRLVGAGTRDIGPDGVEPRWGRRQIFAWSL
jgi:hypothetical protein